MIKVNYDIIRKNIQGLSQNINTLKPGNSKINHNINDINNI